MHLKNQKDDASSEVCQLQLQIKKHVQDVPTGTPRIT